MTTIFDERETMFEQEFAHAEEVRFRERAHRNRLLAGWAAGRMRLDGATAESYVAAFVGGSVLATDEEVLARLQADLAAAGAAEALPGLRAQLERCAATARAELIVGEAVDGGQ
ncbi:protein of unknown function DUF1476 [Methylobacterium sp. 4-46]|uniref:DUF1476 domain-containing protein n=1 Tax=unclassified Methylobacterium TaxID=2615210 RepID=UPI000152DA51|nr:MULTISPECIES: DUF1476 domain-containing protein [Methylobacterium]ACA17975.1 protein of unknown function DUF1476 [Methylobacterium sp. 4-46]WFT77276.1 DUF1476 domain-containing protein [Methylobacterium nodulans]